MRRFPPDTRRGVAMLLLLLRRLLAAEELRVPLRHTLAEACEIAQLLRAHDHSGSDHDASPSAAPRAVCAHKQCPWEAPAEAAGRQAVCPVCGHCQTSSEVRRSHRLLAPRRARARALSRGGDSLWSWWSRCWRRTQQPCSRRARKPTRRRHASRCTLQHSCDTSTNAWPFMILPPPPTLPRIHTVERHLKPGCGAGGRGRSGGCTQSTLNAA